VPRAAPGLFPEFYRRALPPAGAADVGQQDNKRYDRWLVPLPGGQLPTDRDILFWAYTGALGAPPFMGPDSEWSYLPKDALKTGKTPTGLLLQLGKKAAKLGSIHFYMTKTGKLHLSGSDTAKERMITLLAGWTVPWNNGVSPPAAAPGTLPPRPPASWTAP
jgi:hypothetical protein